MLRLQNSVGSIIASFVTPQPIEKFRNKKQRQKSRKSGIEPKQDNKSQSMPSSLALANCLPSCSLLAAPTAKRGCAVAKRIIKKQLGISMSTSPSIQQARANWTLHHVPCTNLKSTSLGRLTFGAHRFSLLKPSASVCSGKGFGTAVCSWTGSGVNQCWAS